MKGFSLICALKKYVAIFSLVIIGALVLNNLLFVHIHWLDDGKIVVHAHPFSKAAQQENSQQQHKHTKVEILVFDSLLLLFTFCAIQLVRAIYRNVNINFLQYSYSLLENSPREISNKAPPYSHY
ncbi:MAG TPA: hypothetical protein ENN24_02485 [Bacteroidetes bacterium]|nr:hypothetical protein [Bacteroidota bacterium]